MIIIFELTMLGAIVSTVVALLLTAGLPGRGEKLYDPEVTEGNILVGIADPPEDLIPELQTALASPPGARVKVV